MRALRHPPPAEVNVRFVPLPAARTRQAGLGIAELIRLGGTPEHHQVADAVALLSKRESERMSERIHAH
jgi:hypothetical protein